MLWSEGIHLYTLQCSGLSQMPVKATELNGSVSYFGCCGRSDHEIGLPWGGGLLFNKKL